MSSSSTLRTLDLLENYNQFHVNKVVYEIRDTGSKFTNDQWASAILYLGIIEYNELKSQVTYEVQGTVEEELEMFMGFPVIRVMKDNHIHLACTI